MNQSDLPVSFSQLSQPIGWYALTLQILPLLADPGTSGFKTENELLSALAAARKLTPRALIKQIDAARFVLASYPDLVKSVGVTGGHSQIEFLEKIRKLDRAAADQLAPAVLRGDLSMVQMRQRYAEAQEKAGPASTSSAVAARRRGIDFEKTCQQVILSNLDVFGAKDASEVVHEYRQDNFTLDFALHTPAGLVGIECKVAGVASARRDALPILSRLALYRYRVQTMWLLVPDWAQHLAEAVQDEAQRWGVTGIRVGTVSESEDPPRLNVL